MSILCVAEGVYGLWVFKMVSKISLWNLVCSSFR
jgi:hypothetical protein